MSARFWQRWLHAAAVLIAAAGLALALFGGTFLAEPFDQLFHRVFWGDHPVDAPARAYQAWIYGVLGTTLAG